MSAARRAARLRPAKDIGAMEPPVVVVGDIHLRPDDPDVQAAFLAFLRSLKGRAAHLVLLGDVFDAWVGDAQRHAPEVAAVLQALGELAASGTRLHFQPGNRDFLFRGVQGLPLEPWPDVVRATWGARRVVLTHGDLLCTADVGYQRLRRVLRSRVFIGLARSVPHLVRRGFGRALRGISRRKTKRAPRAAMGLDYAAARDWLEGYGADVLIAGHVHTGVHHRLPGARPREILVLRDWERGGNVIRWDGEAISLRPVRSGPGSP